MIGQQILDYILERSIGRVNKKYLASHITTGEKFVIEFLPLPSSLLEEDLDLLKSDLKALAELRHPYINSIYEVKERNKSIVVISEYIPGLTLSEYIEQHKEKLSEDAMLQLFNKILEGVSYLHHHNTAHLELSPYKIIVTEDDSVKILDSGLYTIRTSLYRSSAAKPSEGLHYLSPEQLKRVLIDKRSDIYSLGMLLFFIFTGRHPFDEKGIEEHDIYRKIISDPLPHVAHYGLRISDKLQLVIDKATDKDPTRRITSADAMMGYISFPNKRRIINENIAFFTDVQPESKKAITGRQQLPQAKKRWKVNKKAIIAVLFAVMVLATLFTIFRKREGYGEADARETVEGYFAALSEHDADRLVGYYAPVLERYYQYKDYSVEQIMENHKKFWQIAPVERFQILEEDFSIIHQKDGTFDVNVTVRYDVVMLKPYDIFSYDAFTYQTKNIETEQSKKITYRLRLNEELKIIFLIEYKSKVLPGKTAELLSRKWRLVRFYDKDIDQSANNLADKLKYQMQKFMENNYIVFHKDGTYEESLMLSEAKKGKWKLSDNEKVVTITFPKGTIRFNIVELGRNYLITSKFREGKEVITVYQPYE